MSLREGEEAKAEELDQQDALLIAANALSVLGCAGTGSNNARETHSPMDTGADCSSKDSAVATKEDELAAAAAVALLGSNLSPTPKSRKRRNPGTGIEDLATDMAEGLESPRTSKRRKAVLNNQLAQLAQLARGQTATFDESPATNGTAYRRRGSVSSDVVETTEIKAGARASPRARIPRSPMRKNWPSPEVVGSASELEVVYTEVSATTTSSANSNAATDGSSTGLGNTSISEASVVPSSTTGVGLISSTGGTTSSETRIPVPTLNAISAAAVARMADDAAARVLAGGLQPRETAEPLSATPGSNESDHVHGSKPADEDASSETGPRRGRRRRVHKCPQCSYESDRSSALQSHIRHRHTFEKPYQCPHCDYACADLGNLQRHVRGRHTSEKPFKCPHCEYASPFSSALRTHVLHKHTIEKPYKCDFCDYSSAQYGHLRMHVRCKHTDVKPFRCTFCEFATTYSQALQTHVRRKHSWDKPCKCTLCEYTCADASQLQSHVRTKHSDEKPHKCPHCSYASSRHGNLQTHIRSQHTLEKPYKCTECPYASPDRGNLQRHIRRHTLEKPYRCTECCYASPYSSALQTHIRSRHAADRPYQCPRCPYASKQLSHLQSHLRHKHSEHTCAECSFASKTPEELIAHFREAHADLEFDEERILNGPDLSAEIRATSGTRTDRAEDGSKGVRSAATSVKPSPVLPPGVALPPLGPFPGKPMFPAALAAMANQFKGMQQRAGNLDSLATALSTSSAATAPVIAAAASSEAVGGVGQGTTATGSAGVAGVGTDVASGKKEDLSCLPGNPALTLAALTAGLTRIAQGGGTGMGMSSTGTAVPAGVTSGVAPATPDLSAGTHAAHTSPAAASGIHGQRMHWTDPKLSLHGGLSLPVAASTLAEMGVPTLPFMPASLPKPHAPGHVGPQQPHQAMSASMLAAAIAAAMSQGGTVPSALSGLTTSNPVPSPLAPGTNPAVVSAPNAKAGLAAQPQASRHDQTHASVSSSANQALGVSVEPNSRTTNVGSSEHASGVASGTPGVAIAGLTAGPPANPPTGESGPASRSGPTALEPSAQAADGTSVTRHTVRQPVPVTVGPATAGGTLPRPPTSLGTASHPATSGTLTAATSGMLPASLVSALPTLASSLHAMPAANATPASGFALNPQAPATPSSAHRIPIGWCAPPQMQGQHHEVGPPHSGPSPAVSLQSHSHLTGTGVVSGANSTGAPAGSGVPQLALAAHGPGLDGPRAAGAIPDGAQMMGLLSPTIHLGADLGGELSVGVPFGQQIPMMEMFMQPNPNPPRVPGPPHPQPQPQPHLHPQHQPPHPQAQHQPTQPRPHQQQPQHQPPSLPQIPQQQPPQDPTLATTESEAPVPSSNDVSSIPEVEPAPAIHPPVEMEGPAPPTQLPQPAANEDGL